MWLVISFLWKIAQSLVCIHIHTLNYHLFMIFHQERLPIAMGDSFKVMERLFCVFKTWIMMMIV